MPRTYIFRTARFNCGCIYRIRFDTPIMCPAHRTFIVEEKEFRSDTPDMPEITGLVTNKQYNNLPIILCNSSNNSLHVNSIVKDGQGEEWSCNEEEELGLCAACFIENNEYTDTRITACECGNEYCSYRWCGSLHGLHAFWKLHSQNQSYEITGIPERDIFSYGKANELDDNVINILSEQRTRLLEISEILIQDMTAFKNQANNTESDQIPAYSSDWLNKTYEMLTTMRGAQSSLSNKLLRFYVTGLLNIN